MNGKYIKQLRDEGKTFKEIADIAGVSKQAINRSLHLYERKLSGIRGKNFNINNIVFKGIYEHFLNDFDESILGFCRKLKGRHDGRYMDTIRRLITGGNNVRLSIPQIKEICKVVGKPFEEVFEVRENE